MSYPARGPSSLGIDSKANAAPGRRAEHGIAGFLKEAARTKYHRP